MTDNIAEPTVTDVTELMEEMAEPQFLGKDKPALQAEPQQIQRPILFTVPDAYEAIAKHYERNFRNLVFQYPPPTDGCVVEFIDTDVGVTMATARLRFRNQILFVDGGKQMVLDLMLSDLQFGNTKVKLDYKVAAK